MQTRKAYGIIGEGRGKIRVGTNGLGAVQVSIHGMGPAWTGPDLTVEEARALIGQLANATIDAAIEVEREKAAEGMARHLGVKRDEIVKEERPRDLESSDPRSVYR